MSTLSRSTLATLVAGAALALALTGCSATGSGASSSDASASAQSKAAACKSLETSVKASTTDLQSSFGEIATNPDKAIVGLQSVADAFDSGLKKVSNVQVKKAGSDADAALKDMIVQVKAVIGNPAADTTKLKAAVTDVQTSFTAIGKTCS